MQKRNAGARSRSKPAIAPKGKRDTSQNPPAAQPKQVEKPAEAPPQKKMTKSELFKLRAQQQAQCTTTQSEVEKLRDYNRQMQAKRDEELRMSQDHGGQVMQAPVEQTQAKSKSVVEQQKPEVISRSMLADAMKAVPIEAPINVVKYEEPVPADPKPQPTQEVSTMEQREKQRFLEEQKNRFRSSDARANQNAVMSSQIGIMGLQDPATQKQLRQQRMREELEQQIQEKKQRAEAEKERLRLLDEKQDRKIRQDLGLPEEPVAVQASTVVQNQNENLNSQNTGYQHQSLSQVRDEKVYLNDKKERDRQNMQLALQQQIEEKKRVKEAEKERQRIEDEKEEKRIKDYLASQQQQTVNRQGASKPTNLGKVQNSPMKPMSLKVPEAATHSQPAEEENLMGLLNKNADKPPSPMRSQRNQQKPPAGKSPINTKQDEKINELQTLVKSLLEEQKGLKESIMQNNQLVLQQQDTAQKPPRASDPSGKTAEKPPKQKQSGLRKPSPVGRKPPRQDVPQNPRDRATFLKQHEKKMAEERKLKEQRQKEQEQLNTIQDKIKRARERIDKQKIQKRGGSQQRMQEDDDNEYSENKPFFSSRLRNSTSNFSGKALTKNLSRQNEPENFKPRGIPKPGYSQMNNFQLNSPGLRTSQDFKPGQSVGFRSNSMNLRTGLTSTNNRFFDKPDLRMTTNGQGESVRVAIRCRPWNENELEGGHSQVVQIDGENGEITVNKSLGKGNQTMDSLNQTQHDDTPSPNEVGQTYTFDHVYDEQCTQEQIYDECAKQIIENVMVGYNGTIFAYGQTGTGKTYTMCGELGIQELEGIMPRSFRDIFHSISQEDKQFNVRVSYLEIYNEEIRDLLSSDPKHRLMIAEHPKNGFYVKDLSQHAVTNPDEIAALLYAGMKNRTTAATNMNEISSRSHSLLQISVEQFMKEEQVEPTKNKKVIKFKIGKLNLVDLAGSERVSKAGSKGARFKEMTKINLSLSTLCHVISSLTSSKTTHIPYRDSTLTRLLQDSLGGNTKTLMISNIGPSSYNYTETLSTIRYAHRAKKIKNRPRINEDQRDALLREYENEIMYLRNQLDQAHQQMGTTQAQFQGPQIDPEMQQVDIEASIGNLDARGTTVSHFVNGNFQQTKDQAEMAEDLQRFRTSQNFNSHQPKQTEMEKKAGVSVSLNFFNPQLNASHNGSNYQPGNFDSSKTIHNHKYNQARDENGQESERFVYDQTGMTWFNNPNFASKQQTPMSVQQTPMPVHFSSNSSENLGPRMLADKQNAAFFNSLQINTESETIDTQESHKPKFPVISPDANLQTPLSLQFDIANHSRDFSINMPPDVAMIDQDIAKIGVLIPPGTPQQNQMAPEPMLNYESYEQQIVPNETPLRKYQYQTLNEEQNHLEGSIGESAHMKNLPGVTRNGSFKKL